MPANPDPARDDGKPDPTMIDGHAVSLDDDGNAVHGKDRHDHEAPA